MPQTIHLPRRALIRIAGILTAGLVASKSSADAIPSTAPPNGGDFAFLAGQWRIANRRRVDGKWDEFPGEATVHSLLGGLASIEELRIPARNFFGMGVRVYHLKDRKWADHWTSGGNGVVNDPMMGSFENGVGTFLADEREGTKHTVFRSMWDQITPKSCRWTQASSRDEGKSWDYDWYMEWTRT